jgi:para-nitrobenzyl esterase
MLGACHAVELGFVFGTHVDPGMTDFSGTGPAADALSAHTMDAWIAFARTGSPGTPGLGPWPAYTTADRATMVLGARSSLEKAPLEEERSAWSAVPKSILGSI